jgi:hypothetical protein
MSRVGERYLSSIFGLALMVRLFCPTVFGRTEWLACSSTNSRNFDRPTKNAPVERAEAMHPRLEPRLNAVRADFEKCQGKPFQHFYCPILHLDERVPLQMRHIINEAFKGSPGAWVVQRQDVDNFYGTYFEADFEALQYENELTLFSVFADKKLYSHFKPKLFLHDKEIAYYPYRDGPLAPGYGIFELEEGGEVFPLAVRIERERLSTGMPGWFYETRKDFRLAALVSVIKAAHLSMFSLFGYAYAASSAGVFVGNDILGRFFRENRERPSRAAVLRNALSHFREFRHMVRPIQGDILQAEGTLTDGIVRLCGDSVGLPWGMVVFVKTAHWRHAVLLPFPGNPESMAAFYQFLGNDRTAVNFMAGKFEASNREWRIDPTRSPDNWPKSGDIYPTSIE